MTLNSDVKFGMRNWVNFHESTQKSEASFKGKLTRGLRNDIRNLANFDSILESLKICTLIGSF